MGYLIGENMFTGDSILVPDFCSARCDFPGGDARVLFGSIQRLLSFSPNTRFYTGHDYAPADEAAVRDPILYVTVGEQRAMNKKSRTRFGK